MPDKKPHRRIGGLEMTDDVKDEQIQFISHIFPTGYMAAEHCEIQPGQTVAVWGCGPVGQFAKACP
jgi:threonine dehydrogenase-like Zn-dependent dehydrogenase